MTLKMKILGGLLALLVVTVVSLAVVFSYNADCEPGTIGINAGFCTIVERRKCFLDPIVAVGVADATRPVGAAAFCVAPTGNPGINTVAGLPGPARVYNEGLAASFCFGSATQYTPGVGGCP